MTGVQTCALPIYIDNLTKEDLEQMLTFANAAAYLVTTKKGAIRSMPEPEDVMQIIKQN